jgi:hypothetical protein
MARGDRVERPLRKTEFELRFATKRAEQGWTDLLATQRNAIVGAWDFLTATPLAETPQNYRLKGRLAYVVSNGVQCERWQLKPTAQGDARIWFYVIERTVYLEAVHTRHPNATK